MSIPLVGKPIPIIGRKGMEDANPATAQEAAVMIMVQQSIFRMLDQTKAPRGVQVNAVCSTLAAMAAHATLPKTRTEEELQEVIGEAFRRIFDAVASVKDLVERGTEWKAQSQLVKDTERGGGGVELVAQAKVDGKPS